jgi:PadR family transcriptional regulator PadR
MLYNLEAKGLIVSRVEQGDSARPRRYYRLTARGKKQLDQAAVQWEALTTAMGKLGVTGG